MENNLIITFINNIISYIILYTLLSIFNNYDIPTQLRWIISNIITSEIMFNRFLRVPWNILLYIRCYTKFVSNTDNNVKKNQFCEHCYNFTTNTTKTKSKIDFKLTLTLSDILTTAFRLLFILEPRITSIHYLRTRILDLFYTIFGQVLMYLVLLIQPYILILYLILYLRYRYN